MCVCVCVKMITFIGILKYINDLSFLTLYGPALPKSNTNKINYLGHINSFQKKKISE